MTSAVNNTEASNDNNSSDNFVDNLPDAIAAITTEDSNIVEIDLGWKDLDDSDVERLAHAFLEGSNTSISSLWLHGNRIGRDGAIAIANVLKDETHSHALRTISLDNNVDVGNDGAVAMADALRCNTTLQILRMGWNGIGNLGGSAIADALRTNQSLKELSLYINEIGPEAGQDFVRAMRDNHVLTQLNLNGNTLSRPSGKQYMHDIQQYLRINQESRTVLEAEARKSGLFPTDVKENNIYKEHRIVSPFFLLHAFEMANVAK